MKKIMGLLVFVLCLITPVKIARADMVLFELPKGAFWKEYHEEFVYLGQRCVADGPDNKVIIYKNPLVAKERDYIENGTQFLIGWTFEDERGILWGRVKDGINGESRGWVVLDYTYLVYDKWDYEDALDHKFEEKTGEILIDEEGQPARLWDYPGSEEYIEVGLTFNYVPKYELIYEDQAGRTWAKIEYYIGVIGEKWICLDDMNADFETLFPGKTPIEVQDAECHDRKLHEEQIVPNADTNYGMVGIAIAGIVAVTGVILMKWKKTVKVLSLIVAFVLCSQTAHADVIWEPEDSFYKRHKCEMVDRSFEANGPDGEVTVYKSPEDARQVATMKNGEATWITWTYTDADGITWGYPNNLGKGWVPMDYMTVIYDYISFEEEYGSEFVQETGSVDESYMGKRICFWEYPGSQAVVEIDLDGGWATWLPEYHTTYVDEAERKWGFCGYYYGSRNFWVCLDAADQDYVSLYGEQPVKDSTEIEEEEVVVAEIIPKKRFPLEIIGISVGAVVLVTGGILVRMKKKR